MQNFQHSQIYFLHVIQGSLKYYKTNYNYLIFSLFYLDQWLYIFLIDPVGEILVFICNCYVWFPVLFPVAAMQRKPKSYSSALMDQIPIKYLIRQAQGLQQELGGKNVSEGLKCMKRKAECSCFFHGLLSFFLLLKSVRSSYWDCRDV